MLGGHACQEAGGAASFGTADAHKVPRAHNVTRRLCGNLMGHHGVLTDLLEDLKQGQQQDTHVDEYVNKEKF